MKRFVSKLILVACLVCLGTETGVCQDPLSTPFWTGFTDTLLNSTFNGQPLVAGSIIQAYDQSGTYCGVDTVRYDGDLDATIFGYFTVYGDDGNTGVDEGAVNGEQIMFHINGAMAAVVEGDDVWTDQMLKSVVLSASATIAIETISLPSNRLTLWDDTAEFMVEVRNTGTGLDFYGVNLSMSHNSGPNSTDWESFEPDSVVYAQANAVAQVFFSIRSPLWVFPVDDTVNTIYYSVYSHLDPTVNVSDSVDLIISLTDVEDQPDLNLPGSFVMEQNYPNPFNPTTTIAFNLSTRSAARLDIFDVLGRMVDSYDLGQLSAGPGTFELDAAHLASGVYFYRLTTETTAQSRKMILLK